MPDTQAQLRRLIRDIPDFPSPAFSSATSRRCWPILRPGAGGRAAGQSVSAGEHRSGRRRREPRVYLRHARRLLLSAGFVIVRKPGKAAAQKNLEDL